MSPLTCPMSRADPSVSLVLYGTGVLFIPLAILNGAVRESLLVPWLGRQTALPLSGVLLSCLIFLTTYLLFLFMKASVRQAWQIGTIWLCLTVLFEFGFGHFVMGKPWEALLEGL